MDAGLEENNIHVTIPVVEDSMDRKKHLLWEKSQVILAAGVLLAAVYYIFWQGFGGAYPRNPIIMLPAWRPGAILALGAVFCGLAALAGLMTTRSRPEGAILVALIGLGGLSLRSGQMQPLLWTYPDKLPSLFVRMILEIILLAVIMLAAEAVAGLFRGLVKRLRPGWVWSDPLGDLSDEQRQLIKKDGIAFLPSCDESRRMAVTGELGLVAWLVNRVLRRISPKKDNLPDSMPAGIRRSLACLLTGAAVGVVMVSLMMRSTLRGQVLFSLLAGFFIAALVARHFFPVRSVSIAWAMPLITAVIFYSLAAFSSGGPQPDFWASARPQFQALPIDWLTAGCGGAVLGFWTAGRMLEFRVFEHLMQAEEG